MPCLFEIDRTGFPMIYVKEVGVYTHLLPIAKLQLERFLAEPNGFDNDWYEQILGKNPRGDFASFQNESREQLFVSAILPTEIQEFCCWFGTGFDVPTVRQWQAIYRFFRNTRFDEREIPWSSLASPALTILKRLVSMIKPSSLLSLSLMEGGFVEWARDEERWVGLGKPRVSFLPGLINEPGDVHSPINLVSRVHFFGLRLIRIVSIN